MPFKARRETKVMINAFDKNKARERRKRRVRGKISGTPTRPRMCVSKSNKNLFVQLIDDQNGVTIASASTMEKDFPVKASNIEAGKEIGKLIAKRAKVVKIEEVVFDRSGHLYHGVVKQIADSAREEGLKF